WTIGSLDTAYLHVTGAKLFLEPRRKVAVRPRPAAEHVQANGAVLGKRVAREVRLREQAQPGNSAGSRELVPDRFLQRAQLELPDDHSEESIQFAQVGEGAGSAAVRLHHPLKTRRGRFRR